MFFSGDNLASGLSQTIVAMISSNPVRANHPSRVAIPLSSPDGLASRLRLDSWVMTDNLATVVDDLREIVALVEKEERVEK